MKKSQNATPDAILSEIVVPEAAALAEAQKVCQSRSIRLYAETPGLPLAVRNP